jgi:hypothetical protein
VSHPARGWRQPSDEDNRIRRLGSFQPLERRVGSEKEGNGTLEAAPGNEHPLHSAEPASQETDGSGRRADDARGQDGKHGSAPQIGGAYE